MSHEFSVPTDVPESLRTDLIQVDRFDDIYAEDRRRSKRRLQLLYRRFLNQINYGCTNSQCTIATCLSYRKRITNGPVRAYNEISAAALATRCLEDYAVQRPWPALPTKGAHVNDQGDGLCYSDPVIPWYSSPDDIRPGNHESPVSSVGSQPSDASYAQGQDSAQQAQEPSNTMKSPNIPIQDRTKSHVKRKDPASYAQQLFDHQAFLTLGSLQGLSGDDTEPDRRAITGCKKYTLRLLSADALRFLWKKAYRIEHMSEASRSNFIAFFAQSLYYNFSKPQRLFRTVYHWDSTFPDSEHTARTTNLLPTWTSLGMIINIIDIHAQSVAQFLQHLQTAASHAYITKSPVSNTDNRQNSSHQRYMSNADVARLLLIGSCLTDYLSLACGVDEDYRHHGERLVEYSQSVHFIRDRWPVAVAKIIGFRYAMDQFQQTRVVDEKRQNILQAIMSVLKAQKDCDPPRPEPSRWAERLVKDLLLALGQEWNRCPIIRRASPEGGALEMLKTLYKHRSQLDLPDSEFVLYLAGTKFDEVEMPYEWHRYRPNATHFHILQFPFIFPASLLVLFFRSLNLRLMKDSHENAMGILANAKVQLVHDTWHVKGYEEILEKSRAHMASYFVMTIRRDHVLEDALGQVWRRERQELTRPLRVRLGHEAGEEGLDHGGVQQELFRLIFAEAFDEKYGLFHTDSTTHMTWFNPASVEPLYKYEALGVLFALAIYNGVVVSINMPHAFYRKLLGLKVKTVQDIEDGWPEVAKSLSQLLSWEDGDVSESIGVNYTFSYSDFESLVTLDMSRGQHGSIRTSSSDQMVSEKASNGRDSNTEDPGIERTSSDRSPDTEGPGTERTSSNGISNTDDPHPKATSSNDSSSTHDPSLEQNPRHSDPEDTDPPLVTNQNRAAFVKDYITYLTDTTVRAQFSAFKHGLFTAIAPETLALFTPSVLKGLVEGLPRDQPLDVAQWQAITAYDNGYTASSPVIVWFWDILANDFSQDQLRSLLAFVTASDRLSVSGWTGMTFVIQMNGDNDGRLPTSSTCYGYLMLPQYSSREVLKSRLEWAVGQAWGFWMI